MERLSHGAHSACFALGGPSTIAHRQPLADYTIIDDTRSLSHHHQSHYPVCTLLTTLISVPLLPPTTSQFSDLIVSRYYVHTGLYKKEHEVSIIFNNALSTLPTDTHTNEAGHNKV